MKIQKIQMVMMLAGLLLVAAPAGAQLEYQWQSTSTMQGSGSSYSSTPSALGAGGVAAAPNRIGGRNNAAPTGEGSIGETYTDPETGYVYVWDGEQWDLQNVPIGDAVLPLLVLAALGAVAIRIRKRYGFAKYKTL